MLARPTSAASFRTSSGTPRRRCCAPPRRRCSCSSQLVARQRLQGRPHRRRRRRNASAATTSSRKPRFDASGRSSGVVRRRASLVRRLYPYLPDLHRQPAGVSRSRSSTSTATISASPWFSHLPRWRLTSRLKLFFSDGHASGGGRLRRPGRARGAAAARATARWDPFCQSQYLETAHLLPGYLLSSQGDRVAMAHGVECRYPVPRSTASSPSRRALPPSLKMKALNEKYLLKHVARELVPASVVAALEAAVPGARWQVVLRVRAPATM